MRVTAGGLERFRARGVGHLSTVTFGTSSDLRVGDPVVAIGNALGLGGTPSVTAGIVSALGREIQQPEHLTELIQTDRGNADLWYNLGWAYSAQKKYKLGVEAFEKYLELASKDDGLRKSAEAELKALKKKVR